MRRLLIPLAGLVICTIAASCVFKQIVQDEGYDDSENQALFVAAKAVITAKCVSCHGINGGVNFETDAGIVARALRIKDRAVDVGDMPPGNPLTAEEKKKINDWVTNKNKVTN